MSTLTIKIKLSTLPHETHEIFMHDLRLAELEYKQIERKVEELLPVIVDALVELKETEGIERKNV